MNIYVGNLSNSATEDDLRAAFEAHGQVDSARIITDRFSGESRGFGFVEMSSSEEGKAAMEALNGTEFMEKEIKVSEAQGKQGGGGGGRGGFSRGRGGGGGRRPGGRGPGGRGGSRGPGGGGGGSGGRPRGERRY